MGVIGSIKVVTGAERRTRPTLTQPGNREWVTVIQSICAAGYATPPFIIYKGRKLSVSENGWTNNELGLAWLKHFDEHTKTRQSSTVGGHRLLIIDGHESHCSIDFQDLCKEKNIILLCMPPHSSHLLQPLDVACFSPLKRKYGDAVSGLARNRTHYI
ncbi:uncharacterized protein SETTUDRAFT_65552, partial [Exserohilum turcica Et28A]